MNSYGLNELDLKIFNIVKHIENGFFIEAGANDGVRQNNTLILEQYLNWKGLLIEPNKKLYDICKQCRPNSIVENYGLVSDKKEGSTIQGFFDDTGYAESLMAQVADLDEKHDINKGAKAIPVPCCTLNSLLLKHSINKIDLFVLDVEGYEKEVLEGFDIRKYKPSFIVVEVFDTSKHKDHIFEYFNEAGYINEGLISDQSHHDYLFKIK